MNIFISCGEVSGDLYAASFITELLAQRPDLQGSIWGMTGPKAEAACGDLADWPHWSYNELKIMGLGEALAALPRILRLRRAVADAILERRPDAVVLIDSPDYHLSLAACLRRGGYRGRLVSLIPPTVWAWRSGRVRNLKRDFDLCLPLFSFEHRFLLERGARSLWVAHPLVRDLAGCRAPQALREQLKGKRPVALMPGSRRYDIRFHLDTLLGAARRLRDEGYWPVFSVAPGLESELAQELRDRASDFPLWEGEGRELMDACLAVAGVSGTVAVEAMLLRRFMAVIYNVSRFSRPLLRALIRAPHISIPNYLTGAPPLEEGGKPLYPELICEDATPERITRELRRYLENPAVKTEIDRRLEEARLSMGTENAAAFWARSVLNLISER